MPSLNDLAGCPRWRVAFAGGLDPDTVVAAIVRHPLIAPAADTGPLGFLADGGSVADLIATFDWDSTPLGPIGAWSPGMTAIVGLILRSPVPMVTLWGADGVMIYNEAYSVFAGDRHPGLLGSKVREGWAEIAEFNDNVMRVGLAGGTLAFRDQELKLEIGGRLRTVWLDLDYSPILDERGTPAGVIAVVIETTAKVRAERWLSRGGERLRQMFQQAPGFVAMLTGKDHVFDLVNPAFLQLVGHRDVVGNQQGQPCRTSRAKASSRCSTRFSRPVSPSPAIHFQ